ncbi:glycosyltransferase [Mesotoga sp.]|uniref:glycosyltransferase n=1 Tax=Mesotoga sp. TaxID=2053577 RepID=UPI001BD3B709|nr:glycosyltransferase [Mesotoga sp.]
MSKLRVATVYLGRHGGGPIYSLSMAKALNRARVQWVFFSKSCGNVDLIQEGEGGFLCRPDDSECFAHSINKLPKDTELRKKMGTNNQSTIRRFDVENVKEEIKKVYNEVLLG